MRKVLPSILIALIVLSIGGYICTLAMFQGPIVADISDHVQFDMSKKMITLPWYLSFGNRESAWWYGEDADGNTYTWFYYEMPVIWEDAEMNCIVSWQNKNTKLYLGESKAMECIKADYTYVDWFY